MNIQTETAIVPFQDIAKPVRSIDYRISRYSEGEKYRQNEPASLDYDFGQDAMIYDRSGKESAGVQVLGKNIDIYI